MAWCTPFWPSVKQEGDKYLYAVPGGKTSEVPKELFGFTERRKTIDADGVAKQVISAPPFAYTYFEGVLCFRPG